MKILKKDLKNGVVKVKVENLDDLWYLSTIIDPGDRVKAFTLRKIKLESGTDRKTNVSLRKILLTVSVEKTEFNASSALLRVSGPIVDGPEDVSRNSYHTINLELLAECTIGKHRWYRFQLDKLKEAAQSSTSKVLIVILDREEAIIALMKKYGYDVLTTIKGDVQKKRFTDKKKVSFYETLSGIVEDYDKRYEPTAIIIASPSFWKEDFAKQVKQDSLKKKFVFATCASVSKSGINELLKRPEVAHALHKERAAQELKAVDELLYALSKHQPVAYGLEEVYKAAEIGAVKKLLISDKAIHVAREKNIFARIEAIMKMVDNMDGSILIVSSTHEGGRKLDGIGGIAASLRYALN